MNSSTVFNSPTTVIPAIEFARIQPESMTRSIEARCDICNDAATGTRENLIRNGWGITPNFCFCPFHQSQI